MKTPLFTGVCTALVTPFLDGAVNYPMMEQLLKRQIDAGIRAVVICGTTGEAPTLSDEEKLALFRRAKAYTGDDCLIIAGTGSNCTSHTAELSLAAEKEGVDALRAAIERKTENGVQMELVQEENQQTLDRIVKE